MNTTTLSTTTPTPVNTANGSVQDNRPMKLREADEQLRQAILNKKRAQIDAWSMQIEQVQQALDSAADSVRTATELRLEELTQARDQAQAQLEQLQQATQESWESLLRKTDDVFQSLARRFHDFAMQQH